MSKQPKKENGSSAWNNTAAQHTPGTYLVCVCVYVYVRVGRYLYISMYICVCIYMYVCMYCNRPLNTEFPASVTTKAASGLYGPFSRTSLETSSLSQSKNKHLLPWITAFRFYCQFAPIHTYYKVTQFTYMNCNTGVGKRVLIRRRHWLIHRTILPCRLVHINCIHWFPIQVLH